MHADAEVMSVGEKLEALRMDVSVDMSPRVATLRDAFDRGLRVLHHCVSVHSSDSAP
jgi:hypothetical protein